MFAAPPNSCRDQQRLNVCSRTSHDISGRTTLWLSPSKVRKLTEVNGSTMNAGAERVCDGDSYRCTVAHTSCEVQAKEEVGARGWSVAGARGTRVVRGLYGRHEGCRGAVCLPCQHECQPLTRLTRAAVGHLPASTLNCPGPGFIFAKRVTWSSTPLQPNTRLLQRAPVSTKLTVNK